MDPDHLGSVTAHLGAGFGKGDVHLVEDKQAALAGLFEGFAEDVFGKALDLAVHLEGVDAGGGAGDLEVHVAQEVFHSLDVAEDGVFAVGVGNEAHGDTGDGSGNGDTGVHEGEGAAADAAHGSAAVGAEDFRYHADGVGEVFFGGEHGEDGAFGQGAMTNFPAAGGTHAAGFTGGVGREIVVVHVPLGAVGADGVEGLLHGEGGEGGDGQDLGLAAGEEAGAVGAGEDAGFGGDGAYLVEAAAVGTDILVKNPAAHF